MISASLVQILCCPETHLPLRVAEPVLLERVNQEISRGGFKNRGGSEVKEPIAEGLVRADGKIIYSIRNGIPVLLANEGIPVPV